MKNENIKPADRVELLITPRWSTSQLLATIFINDVEKRQFSYHSETAPFYLLQIFTFEPFGHSSDELAIRVCDPNQVIDPEDRREQLYQAVYKLNQQVKPLELTLIKKESGKYICTLPIFLSIDLNPQLDPSEFLYEGEELIP